MRPKGRHRKASVAWRTAIAAAVERARAASTYHLVPARSSGAFAHVALPMTRASLLRFGCLGSDVDFELPPLQTMLEDVLCAPSAPSPKRTVPRVVRAQRVKLATELDADVSDESVLRPTRGDLLGLPRRQRTGNPFAVLAELSS